MCASEKTADGLTRFSGAGLPKTLLSNPTAASVLITESAMQPVIQRPWKIHISSLLRQKFTNFGPWGHLPGAKSTSCAPTCLCSR